MSFVFHGFFCCSTVWRLPVAGAGERLQEMKPAGELQNDAGGPVGLKAREHNKSYSVRRMDYALSKMWVYLF